MADAQFDRHEDHVFVSRFRKFAYGLGNFGTCISENLVMNFVMYFYPIILKLNPSVVGLALIAPRVWDAVSDPAMGQISDRTRTRWGRRRPYLLFGAPVFAFLTFLMFAPPLALSDRGLTVYIFVVALLYYTSYTVIVVPYTALGAELSIDYHERTRVQAWRSVLMFSASFITPWTWSLAQLPVFPNERVGSMWVTGGFSFLVLIPVWLCFFGTREESELQEQAGVPLLKSLRLTFGNKGFVLLSLAYAFLIIGLWGGFGLGNYVNIYYVFGGEENDLAARLIGLNGTTMTITSIVGTLFWTWFGTRLGKKQGLMASFLATAAIAPFSWFLFSPQLPYLQVVNSGLLGFCFGALAVFPNAMVADLCDVDELESGCRREGAYNGVISFVVKLGFSGTFFMTGTLLKLSGFEEKADVQAPQVMTNVRMLLILVPIAVMLITTALIWFYPLSEQRVREIRAILEERRKARSSVPIENPATEQQQK